MLHAATMFADEIVKIFFSVIVRQFFARLDVSTRMDKHFIPDNLSFAIWSTRVVNVSRNVLTGLAVDSSSVFEIKQIFSTTTVCFIIRNTIAIVFQDGASK